MMVYPEDSNIDVKQHVELAWSPDTDPVVTAYKKGPHLLGILHRTQNVTERRLTTGERSSPLLRFSLMMKYVSTTVPETATFSTGVRVTSHSQRFDPDGWAGYEPITTDMPAVITTQPLTFDGTSVGITADVSDGGSVRVAILDEAGNQLASSQLVRIRLLQIAV